MQQRSSHPDRRPARAQDCGTVLAVALMACSLLSLTVVGVGHAESVRLMAIGDSVTHGDGSSNGLGFRDDLHRRLTNAGVDLQMVGSMGDSPYRAHFSGGKRIRQFYPRSYGNGWGTGTVDITADVSVLTPRVALIHLGTNDINSYHTPFTPYSDNGGETLVESAAGKMAELVSYLLQWSDGTRGDHLESIVLSRIIPINYREEDVRAFNAEIEKMIEDFVEGSITGRPERILLTNHYGRFKSNSRLFSFGSGDWMTDDLHPNDAGYQQIAELYAQGVLEALRDHEPPAQPVLRLGARSGREIALEWLAPGDDGVRSRAERYDLRFSTSPIDENNFRRARRVLSEPDPATAGTAQSLRVGSLERNRNYYFALRVVDNAANRAPLGLATVRTTEDAGYATDAFERDGIGESWARSLSIELADGAAHAPDGDPALAHLMVYTPQSNVGSVEVVLGDNARADDIDGLGLALRLDRANHRSRGYAVVRDGREPHNCRLLEIRDGRVIGEIDAGTGSLPAPGAGDRIGVFTDEAGGAYLFKLYINGELDIVLRDPSRRIGSSRRYGGVIFAGGAQVAVDRINLLHPSARAYPEPVELRAPGNGHATDRRPTLRWEPSLDPNVGQTVRYTVHISTSPAMTRPDSARGLEGPSHTVTHDLEPDTEYFWRVRAYDTTGRGSVSTVSSFVTASSSAGIGAGPGVPGLVTELMPATPNPFNPRTRIGFRLATSSTVRLSIYDVTGRLVRRLADDHRPAGEHSVWWDGRDAAGRSASSGIYLVRFEAAGGSCKQKIVLAR